MATPSSEDFTFAAIVALFHENWRLVLKAVVAAFVLTLVYLHIAQRTYTVTELLTPVEPAQQLSSGIGGLTDVMGLGTSMMAPDFAFYDTALKSSMTAEAIARRPDLMHLIFRRQWSAAERRWKQPSAGPLALVKNGLRFVVGLPAVEWSPPDTADVQAFLSRELAADYDRRAETIMLTLQWPDPEAAKRILAGVSGLTDTLLRERDLVRAKNYSSYASSEMQQSSTLEYREALAQLLVQQEQRKMIASANLPFAAQALGVPMASKRPTSPPALVMIVLSLPAGAFFGLAFAYLRKRYDFGWLGRYRPSWLGGLQVWGFGRQWFSPARARQASPHAMRPQDSTVSRSSD